MRRLMCHLLALLVSMTIFSSPLLASGNPSDYLTLGAAKPYTIIQLGQESTSTTDSDNLDIDSNSSVFGSTLKGRDTTGGNENKLSTSKITGSWDRQTGVTNSESSSFTGSQSTLSNAQFSTIGQDAVGTSVFWGSQTGVSQSINLNSSNLTLDASSFAKGANNATIIDVNGDFILNSDSRLTLTGGANDFFVFNISADSEFDINSSSIIDVTGGIDAMDVLFNVQGNVEGPGPDGASINSASIFQGTLLAPGRDVTIQSNHFFTFVSGGTMDNDGGFNAPSTTEITAEEAIAEKGDDNNSEWGGIFGTIVAGGAIEISESDFSYQPFMAPVPVPAAVWLFGSALIGLFGLRRRRQSR